MPRNGFNLVFYSLLALAAFGALVLTPSGTTTNRPQIGMLFAPVAKPARSIAVKLRGKVDPPVTDIQSPKQTRPQEDVYEENSALRTEVASLTGQLNKLKERDAELSRYGPLRELCKRASVIGSDAGTRESIQLSVAASAGLLEDMPVLDVDGLVGRVAKSSVAGTTVQLISDRSSRLTGAFARFVARRDGSIELIRIPTDPLHVEGSGGGDGMLRIRTLNPKQIEQAKIVPGDWVVLNDSSWPEVLQYYRIGVVESVGPSRSAPGFWQATIRPGRDLKQLRDVMVMVKQ